VLTRSLADRSSSVFASFALRLIKGMAQPHVIITIDGPAGTGKSTVAYLLSKRLGLEFLDTGAMYRAAALIAIEHGIPPHDGAAVAEAVMRDDLHFDWSADPPKLFVGARDVTNRIRDLDVSGVVSVVAAQPQVRNVLVHQQRNVAMRHPRLVSEGRDQGSVVFPNASLRFYLHADVKIRAGRRIMQLQAAGKSVDESRILRDIQERDRIDSTRADGPLIKPQGAIDIDTGERNVTQVVDAMEAIARERLPEAQFIPHETFAAQRH
jgi:CMP/dCMP kinase